MLLRRIADNFRHRWEGCVWCWHRRVRIAEEEKEKAWVIPAYVAVMPEAAMEQQIERRKEGRASYAISKHKRVFIFVSDAVVLAGGEKYTVLGMGCEASVTRGY